MGTGSSLEHDVSTAPLLGPMRLPALPDWPKVSVLISNYNYAKYLPEAIESVLAQTYQDFELIICDDGSTDNSREIVSAYRLRDTRVSLIAKDNGGQASGFNTAFAASNGDVICFFDSDDIFRPEKVAFMVEAHRKTPQAGFGIHRVQRVNKQRQPRGVWPRGSSLPNGWYGDRMLQGGGALNYMPPTSGLSMRRAVAERIFPLPESFRVCADQAIISLAVLLTPVLSRQEILTEYRLHGENSYERQKRTAESILREITMCRNLWAAQHDFLESFDPQLAAQLQPIEDSSYLLHLEYLYARFSRSPYSRASYHRLIRAKEAGPREGMWFWKNSIYLPSFVFDALINLMYSPSLFKEVVTRLRRAK